MDFHCYIVMFRLGYSTARKGPFPDLCGRQNYELCKLLTHLVISIKPTDSLGRLQVMKMMTIPQQIRERVRSDRNLNTYRTLKI